MTTIDQFRSPYYLSRPLSSPASPPPSLRSSLPASNAPVSPSLLSSVFPRQLFVQAEAQQHDATRVCPGCRESPCLSRGAPAILVPFTSVMLCISGSYFGWSVR